jgi:hypothetical protein
MSLGPSLSSASGFLHQSLLFNNNKQQQQQQKATKVVNKSRAPHHHHYHQNSSTMNTKFSYRTCPICSQKLLVRINGSFVYKWISTHFSAHHHEWMHVVVNLHES